MHEEKACKAHHQGHESARRGHQREQQEEDQGTIDRRSTPPTGTTQDSIKVSNDFFFRRIANS